MNGDGVSDRAGARTGRWGAAQWLALVVLLLGAGLRVHALGQDALWYDEAGQITAAMQPTLIDMLRAVHRHAMAMPLDYLVTRVAATLTPDLVNAELLLRVPALLWGTLALATGWALARRIVGRRAALLALVLLSLWAQHVYYSQELRFYAALTFFSLLAATALLSALRQPTARRRWLLAGTALVVGSYFHAYVLLALVVAGAALLVAPPAGAARRPTWLGLGATALAAGLLFAPGFWYFSHGQQFGYDLWQYGGSLDRVVGQGLGWLAIGFSDSTPIFGLWEGLLIAGLVLGLSACLLAPRRQRRLLALAGAAVAQIALILAADAVKSYWFLGRQLLAVAPLGFMVAGHGFTAAADGLARVLGRPALRAMLPAAVALALVIGALPNLNWYYTFPRTTSDEIATILTERHQPGEPVYILSPFESDVYRFYLRRLPDGAAVLPDLHQLAWADLPALPATAGPTYVVVSARETDEHLALVAALGYKLLFGWGGNWIGVQSLYVSGP